MDQLFQFKQFAIAQDRAAMKVGIDAVLLGAWASITHQPESILDIGAGTGVIALQLAQRSGATLIDAVEIDEAAYEQCQQNFENSPWGDRLFCYHASIQEFASEIDENYDLIVSNPPFFTENFKTDNQARDLARFADALPFRHLLVCAEHLLSDAGRFSVIFPKKNEKEFLSLAAEVGLFPKRICQVKGNENTPIVRVMIELIKEQQPIEHSSLTIEIARQKYTAEYIALVKDFYLKM